MVELPGRRQGDADVCTCQFRCPRPRDALSTLCADCEPCDAVEGNHGCRCQTAACAGRDCAGLRRRLAHNGRATVLATVPGTGGSSREHAALAVGQPPNARRGVRRRTQADVHATSEAMVLSRPLEPDLGPWTQLPSAAEAAEARRILAEHHRLVRTANKGDQRLGTALIYLKLFTTKFPSRKLFHSLDGGHTRAAARHNSETKGMLAAFIREHGSIKKGSEGAPLKQATVAGYVSAIATECTVAGATRRQTKRPMWASPAQAGPCAGRTAKPGEAHGSCAAGSERSISGPQRRRGSTGSREPALAAGHEPPSHTTCTFAVAKQASRALAASRISPRTKGT